jgi:hypothetical protein
VHRGRSVSGKPEVLLEQIKDARNKKKREKSTAWFNDDGLDDIVLPFLPTGDTVTFEGSVVIKKDLTVERGRMITSRADIAEWVKRFDNEEDIRPGMVVGWVVGRGISLSTAGADKLDWCG